MVAPFRVPEHQIHHFIALKQDWVVKAQGKIVTKVRTEKKWAAEQYTEGVLVPYQGQQVKIALQSTDLKKVKIELSGMELMIFLPVLLKSPDKSEFIRFALIDWMKQQAKKEVKTYVEVHAKKYNLHPRLIKIKTQKSRWGSCGIHNDININWLLIMAPPKVFEYVVVHELCHIKERNHSANFWCLVEKHLPDYQKQRQWLKQNGSCLMQGL